MCDYALWQILKLHYQISSGLFDVAWNTKIAYSLFDLHAIKRNIFRMAYRNFSWFDPMGLEGPGLHRPLERGAYTRPLWLLAFSCARRLHQHYLCQLWHACSATLFFLKFRWQSSLGRSPRSKQENAALKPVPGSVKSGKFSNGCHNVSLLQGTWTTSWFHCQSRLGNWGKCLKLDMSWL